MSLSIDNEESAARVVPVACAALLGLNAAILSGFLFVVAVVAATEAADFHLERSAFFLVWGGAALVGLIFGIQVGRWSAPWFRRRGRVAVYVWLAFLISWAVMSFPRPFTYLMFD